jgi:hypothetical protein
MRATHSGPSRANRSNRDLPVPECGNKGGVAVVRGLSAQFQGKGNDMAHDGQRSVARGAQGATPEVQDSGPSWVKSSLSFSNGACVEVADLREGITGVRHSKDPSGPVLRFTPAEWQAFLGGVRLGEFDKFGE